MEEEAKREQQNRPAAQARSAGWGVVGFHESKKEAGMEERHGTLRASSLAMIGRSRARGRTESSEKMMNGKAVGRMRLEAVSDAEIVDGGFALVESDRGDAADFVFKPSVETGGVSPVVAVVAVEVLVEIRL